MHEQEATRTLAFLFTDIEGSTTLWERFPLAMKASLARHDAILRNAVESAAGEVVKTTGDGLMAVFATAGDGMRACVQAQLALAAEPWNEAGPLRVRMGLHVGEAAASQGDYHGPTVNRAARLMAAGHGGQILLSAVAGALVGDALPGGATLRDLGEHRLKGLERPERMFQLVHPGLMANFPPLLTLDERKRDLPVESSAFVGREAELAEIEARLRDDGVHLLTLLGPGGIGKTRLALRAAAELRDLFGDGVCFVNLEAARSAASVLVAIARAVGLADTDEGSQLDELVRRLRDRRRLMVLDNFEQVTIAASTVSRLLDDCPTVKWLVTSREALHLRGEHRFPVPPLTLPDAVGRRPTAEQVKRCEAVQLFVERAQTIRPEFRLTDENAGAIAEICQRLDGLPLAIELATARIGLFSPEALQERLGSRLTLLRSGARDLPERQQTLRGTIEWSYQLLAPGEQRLFELLSAFAGTRIEAVEAVASSLNGQLAGVDPVEGLASLVDKSLIRPADSGEGAPRFAMLETIREYASERLGDSPDFDAAVRRAHATYYADFIQHQIEELGGPGRAPALAAMATEAENLRLCWRHWRSEGDLDRLNALVDGLWALYDSRGWYRATIELAADLLRLLAATPAGPERASAEVTLRMSQARALMAMEGYTPAVEAEYTRALALIKDGQDRQLLPVLRSLGTFYNFRADFAKAAEIGRELQALADRNNDPSTRMDGNLLVGVNVGFITDLRSGSALLEATIDGFEAHPYRASRLRLGADPRVPCLTTSAFFLWLLGYPDRSLARANQAVELALSLQHPVTHAYALFHSGFLHLWRQEAAIVRSRALALIEIADDHELPIWSAVGTFLLGAASAALGQVEEGLSALRHGIARYREMKTPPVFWPMLLQVLAGAYARAGATAEGLASIDQAIGIFGGMGRAALLPEMLIIKGDLLAAGDSRTGDGPVLWYRRALETAAAFDVPMSQLRAALRLCRLPQNPETTRACRRELQTIYATFTEGFTTADLAEAREQLEA
jgi:predicted ATPase/class 3 adenylate cyclase